MLKELINEWNKYKNDNSNSTLQRKELHSIQKAIRVFEKEKMTPEEREQVNAILADDLIWCD